MKIISKFVLTGLLGSVVLTGCSVTGADCEPVVKESAPLKVLTPYESLTSTNSGKVLLLGWDEAKSNGYVSSSLSEEQKESYTQKGLKRLESMATSSQLDEAANGKASAILSFYYMEKKDFKNSLRWGFYGVTKGSSSCAESLYAIYITGMGVVQDYEEAYKWKYIASALGSEKFQKLIVEDIRKSRSNILFSQKLEEGNRRAKEWEREHPELFISFD